jgi:hypothetical protein
MFTAVVAFFAGLIGVFSSMFGGGHSAAAIAPSQPAAVVTSVPSTTPASVTTTPPIIATTTIIKQYITQPVIERIIEKSEPVGSVLGATTDTPVTHSELDTALGALRSEFSVTSSGHSSGTDLTAVWQAIALSNKIDKLPANVTIGNSAIATQSYVSDSVSSSLSSSYLPITGGSLLGTLTVPNIVSTSSVVSSFVGAVDIGTTSALFPLTIQKSVANKLFEGFYDDAGVLMGQIETVNTTGNAATRGLVLRTPAVTADNDNWMIYRFSGVDNMVAFGDTGSVTWMRYGFQHDLYFAPKTGSGFLTSTSPTLALKNSGNVGVASSSPWKTFSVTGTVGFDGLTGSTGAGSLCLDSNKQVVYNSGSDACLASVRSSKHDIQNLTIAGTSTVAALQAVSFIYNYDASSTVRYGFIAEDAAAVDQHLATYDAHGAISGIDDRSVISVLVKAVQELIATVSRFADNIVSAHITATVGDFDTLNAQNAHLQQLCIGSTCVTEEQLKALLQNQNVAPSQANVAASVQAPVSYAPEVPEVVIEPVSTTTIDATSTTN